MSAGLSAEAVLVCNSGFLLVNCAPKIGLVGRVGRIGRRAAAKPVFLVCSFATKSFTNARRNDMHYRFARLICLALLSLLGLHTHAQTDGLAKEILSATGVRGGLVVHLGCGDGQLTAALRENPSYRVHGLARRATDVVAAQKNVQAAGLYGPVAVDQLSGTKLPYIDNLVNLLVSEDLAGVPMAEVMRVLCPEGVAYIKTGGTWQKTVKPRPKTIDEWTHYLHDSTNNAVAHDTVVAPPRHVQWLGGPRWARHHDRLASMSALVATRNRIFYIFDEGSTASILLPSRWKLIARDAFNGTLLWKRDIPDWHTHLWPLKSGPAQLPRRLVAIRDTVFATLGIDVAITALDAATGETMRTYEATKGTEEILVADGVIFALVDPEVDVEKYRSPRAVNKPWWTGKTVQVKAVEATTGAVRWQHESSVVPLTLTVAGKNVLLHDGTRIVCLDRDAGGVRWESEPIPVVKRIMSFFAPTLLARDGVVLFAGGEESGLVKSTGGATKSDTLTALDIATGKVLWTGKHAPSGYSSPEDLFVIDGVVWSGATSNGSLSGEVTGRDIHTGEVKSRFEADVETYWFHHRCYRGKATDRYLMTSRTGIEFIDPSTGHWDINHWVRGGCLYGIMPANGLVYAPPHDCACYPESKQFGFSVLAPASESRALPKAVPDAGRLERGPAYATGGKGSAAATDWPTFRGDERRSGSASVAVPAGVKQVWRADLGGILSTAVVASGMLIVCSIDEHTVFALDAETGKIRWQRTVGGAVDSPPTIYQGLALFGAADGYVYCLRTDDGELVWRFRAAPVDRRQMAFQRVESLWPVHGSVLVDDGELYCVAGRSMFLDGGLRFLKLDPKTGKKLAEVVLDHQDPESDGNLQAHVKWLNMPVALPDVLSSDGQYVYMRSQRFDRDGKRYRLGPRSKDRFSVASDQQGEGLHLFSPSGFLDGSWFHRSYWVHGVTFSGGWNGYCLGGKFAPAGRILVMDETNVYGFGRKPNYYKWTTQIEHQLFAAPKIPPSPDRKGTSVKGTAVWIENSASLDPSNKPLTVMAWVKRGKKSNGVIISRGGPIHGYALAINKGRAEFHLRADKKLTKVVGKGKIPGGWVHLAGILTADKQLRVYVNGQLSKAAAVPALIPKAPAQATQIGIDDQGAVGDYRVPSGFTGVIDEVRVYHRALGDAELQQHVTAPAGVPKQAADLVLCMSFDDGRGPDESGNKNKGRVDGAKPVKGKVGQALQFKGKPGDGGFLIKHQWTMDMPIFVRAMVLTGEEEKILFIAGPPDLVNEEEALRRFADPEMQVKLAQQEQAMLGKMGAKLMAVSAADGKTLAELQLESTPVWDGLISANGKLYMTTEDGKVLCLGPAQ